MLDFSTIAPGLADISPSTYFVTLTPGADVDAYVKRIAAAQPDSLEVQANNGGDPGMASMINSVLVAIAAVIALMAIAGVFNTLLLNTREGVRDTATLKAVGMTPRQVVAMVAASAGFLALLGGALAVPAGIGLNRVLFDLISNFGGNTTPPAAYDVFAAWELAAIPLAGVILAIVAAIIPGRWAARTNVAMVLRAE
jgi:putative ABC transport system permease protein